VSKSSKLFILAAILRAMMAVILDFKILKWSYKLGDVTNDFPDPTNLVITTKSLFLRNICVTIFEIIHFGGDFEGHDGGGVFEI
jgi:hypothetical protein